MKILITGGNGFVGSHLCKVLSDHDLAVFDRGRIAVNDCQFHRGDIADHYSISRAFEEYGPDIVVHLAGMVSRRECEETPQLAIQTNVQGTYNICSLCKTHDARLIYSGSSEEYGSAYRDQVVTETTPFGTPSGMYSMTKRMAEEVIEHSTPNGLEATAMRFFMFYGPGEPPTPYRSALVRFVHAALHDEPLTVHRGTSRSWCYIGDGVEAIKAIIEREQRTRYEVYNIGRSDPIPTKDLAEKIVEMTDSMSMIRVIDPEPTIIPNKDADFSRIRNVFGWEAKTPLDEGLRRVIDFLGATT